MIEISIIYFSGFGHTKKLAETVLRGAQETEGCNARLIPIAGSDIVEGKWQNDDVLAQLDKSDAIIFGSPTYMGCIAAELKAFMDATGDRYASQRWKDKIAAGFSVSGGPSGDKFNSMVTMAAFAMQHAMIWVGLGMTVHEDGDNRLGFYFGAGGQALWESPEDAPGAEDKKTAELFGIRIAEVTKKFVS